MAKLLGIIGCLVICAGLDLLWQSRREIRFWITAYVNSLRAMTRRKTPMPVFPGSPVEFAAFVRTEMRDRRHGAVRFLLGIGFAFLLGPILIALGLTLMFYTNL